MEINNRPNPNEAFPNPKIPSLCFIKNVVKNPRIIIGDYTYYDDVDGADQAEVRDNQFPIDLEKAYELGKRLVGKCDKNREV